MIDKILDGLWSILFFIVLAGFLFFNDATILHSVDDGKITDTYFLSKKDCEKAMSLIENKKVWCSSWRG